MNDVDVYYDVANVGNFVDDNDDLNNDDVHIDDLLGHDLHHNHVVCNEEHHYDDLL